MMKSTVLLILALCLVHCAPKRKNTSVLKNINELLPEERSEWKRRWQGQGTIGQRRIYEKIHYEDYSKNKDYYRKWDHVKPAQLEKFCQSYVLKLFSMSADARIVPSLMPDLEPLRYGLIEDENGSPLEPALVKVFQCFYPASNKRVYYHYIKSPKPHCLFMVKPVARNWRPTSLMRDMQIVNEFCLSTGKRKQIDNVEGSSKIPDVAPNYVIGKGKGIRSGETTPEKRSEYEKEHFADYVFNRDEYMMWPELNTVRDKVSFCRNFIMKIYGIGRLFLSYKIIPEIKRTETLVYIDLKRTSNNELRFAIISLLQCKVPKASVQRYFYLTRSSKRNCILLLKRVSWNLPRRFGIINRLCEGYTPEDDK